MPASLTPLQARTAITKPVGSDVFSLAALVGMSQSIADRGEWNAKKLIDVKQAQTTATDNDFSNTSFADAASLGALTFTDVKIGDIILLHASLKLHTTVFTADATNPGCKARFYVNGAIDASIAAGAHPQIEWGSTVASGASDFRMLTWLDAYAPASDASSLPVRLQYLVPTASQTVFTEYAKIVGVHLRLGAA